MMQRISELLAPQECQMLYTKITTPEGNIFAELDRLSAKKNIIKKTRRRREITTIEDCITTLTKWLVKDGNKVYWDRISRALRQIGRSDVSAELGKNLNQDKNLEIQKNVEQYHESVAQIKSSLLLAEEEKYGEDILRGREVRAINWNDLELIIERKRLPPYSKKISDGLKPFGYGAFFGLIGSITVFFTGSLLFFYIHPVMICCAKICCWKSLLKLLMKCWNSACSVIIHRKLLQKQRKKYNNAHREVYFSSDEYDGDKPEIQRCQKSNQMDSEIPSFFKFKI
ncbi:transmembrane and death domain protein 1 [Protopterus annectens]|uniref:transmembrane and death domain protein 1 n=1 Tax=Protopterus annectens TaxID=7888 RepID=UPI001CF96E35|nr:transmembrane and death domain protein 1 [Protopterus annectens]